MEGFIRRLINETNSKASVGFHYAPLARMFYRAKDFQIAEGACEPDSSKWRVSELCLKNDSCLLPKDLKTNLIGNFCSKFSHYKERGQIPTPPNEILGTVICTHF
jgi:hypothetical protein